MDDGGLNVLRGTCLLWHDRQQLATVGYELAQTGSALDPVSITGRLIGLPQEQALTLFGLRLTLLFEDGQRADCFLADLTGRIALTANGLH
jgi:hypothetical protein